MLLYHVGVSLTANLYFISRENHVKTLFSENFRRTVSDSSLVTPPAALDGVIRSSLSITISLIDVVMAPLCRDPTVHGPHCVSEVNGDI